MDAHRAPAGRELRGEAPERACDLGNGVYQLPTDYPEVCNAPLWTYLLADGDRFALIPTGIRSTFAATLDVAVRDVASTPPEPTS